MNNNRPVFLDLLKMRFPPAAIMSILHRISGVITFLLIPLLLWVLHLSMASQQSFTQLQDYLGNPWLKLGLWVLLGGLLFHLVAGIRHLLMDAHIGEEAVSGRISAYVTAIVGIILIILAGIWLW